MEKKGVAEKLGEREGRRGLPFIPATSKEEPGQDLVLSPAGFLLSGFLSLYLGRNFHLIYLVSM